MKLSSLFDINIFSKILNKDINALSLQPENVTFNENSNFKSKKTSINFVIRFLDW